MIKMFITIYSVVLMTYTSEIFPTEVRSQAYGLCMTMGQLGKLF